MRLNGIFHFFILTSLSVHLSNSKSFSPKYVTNSTLQIYEKAAVTTYDKDCANIGTDILKKNGSAVDAAIAVLICEGVAAFPSMGLGGGFTMVIYNASTKKTEFLSARDMAPAAAFKDMFHGDSLLSFQGGLAIAVPGELMGCWEAHKKYGKLPWKELLEPSIRLSEIGSTVTKNVNRQIKSIEKEIRAEPTLRSFLINPVTDELYTTGDRIKRPLLAKTLRRLADASNPVEVFYKEFAEDFVKEIQAAGGIVTKEDFENYSIKWDSPAEVKLDNFTVFTSNPPGSGSILAFIMNILKDLVKDIEDEGILWHRMIEAFKWGFAKRTELADPDVFPDEVENLLKDILSDDYADKIRNQIKDNVTYNDPEHYGAHYENKEDHGTGHISVLAPDGSAVAVTSTINHYLGAKIASESTGIIFNNNMDDFSNPGAPNSYGYHPAPMNYAESKKRPLSSTSPTIVLDSERKVRLVVGCAGGPRIMTSVATVMVFNLFRNYNIKEAIDVQRFHHQMLPMEVSYEAGASKDVVDYLEKIGHKTTGKIAMVSQVTGISVENGKVFANADGRSGSQVSGF